ncbi:uncharacterized protein Z518_01345 [Rhinocladiella mackenziei CBS 650.93]|uniref:Mitochondrial protein Fmp25 n=1 Tax=Rhinocladiella mackenziei CBS 650.93 TaxID=1442369 RepID=A0A0D2IW45_9EURO|nr:uncharacterized protein Z518_01345 [Rhinocladiella mackenziei CBS 650.93]KIX10264.1 hypothetical protein Z518_01345 [Rhinocladiella mackenziei CBS 650.93]
MSARSFGATAIRSLARSHRAPTIRPRSRAQLMSPRKFSHRATPYFSPHQPWRKKSAAIFAAAAVVAIVYTSRFNEVRAEAPPAPTPEPPELIVEEPKKKKGVSKEENRDMISSQHLQVKKSWENPGVYAWGSNASKVAAPGSKDVYVKTPRRIPYFDDVLLRDIKLDMNFGAAVLENGDLVQWGAGYSDATEQPTATFKGKNLTSIEISKDRIIGLSKNGTVYSIPVSKVDQDSGFKPIESSWMGYFGKRSDISYRKLQPKNLGMFEKVTAISGGLEHVVLLTNAGRAYTAASGTEDFPSRGQLGVPGLTWLTRPKGPYDMCHELETLKGFKIQKVVSGDLHSVLLDKSGRVFVLGDNSSGQLGIDSTESPYVETPTPLPINGWYQGANQVPKVTNVFAGGKNSIFTIDATRVAGRLEDPAGIRNLGRVTADAWICGRGIKGSLANGKWTHIQEKPVKIPALSGLFEYDEKKHRSIPIRMANFSIGSEHTAAVMANVTYLDANERGSEDDTNWGADVLWWGGNEYYQLGTGKRNNVATPLYIRPLDMAAEIEVGRKDEHRFHITPKHKVKVKGRKVEIEQRVECGRNVTAVYSGV